MCALVALATAVLFLWPPQDNAGRADAVVVLSGDHGERLSAAMRLMRQGVAPVLVLNGTPDSLEAIELCRGGRPFEVVCLRPMPDNTRTEARAAAELATQRDWQRIVVVTSTYHVSRATLLFRRCVRGDVTVVGARPDYGARMAARQVVHEWLGTLHAASVARSC